MDAAELQERLQKRQPAILADLPAACYFAVGTRRMGEDGNEWEVDLDPTNTTWRDVHVWVRRQPEAPQRAGHKQR